MLGVIIKYAIIFLVIYYLAIFIKRIALPFWNIYKQLNSPENKQAMKNFTDGVREYAKQQNKQNNKPSDDKKTKIKGTDDYIDYEEIK